nr:MAG: hypothetical protein EDM05_03235 [Leptolyngbya sp. IPPAS B-1204]
MGTRSKRCCGCCTNRLVSCSPYQGDELEMQRNPSLSRIL